MAMPFLISLIVGWCIQIVGYKPQDLGDIPVRQMLRAFEFKAEGKALLALGEKGFPDYLRILEAKDLQPIEATRIFGLLRSIKADRSRFLDHAITGLASPHPGVRQTAVELLAQIGSERDVVFVVALLSDKEWTIPYAAAKTLTAIGDRRTVIAMDVWLSSAKIHNNSGSEKDNELLRKHVIKCRDELKQRLEKVNPIDR